MLIELDIKLYSNERIIGQYETRSTKHFNGPIGDKGLLVVTSQRILYYQKASLATNLIKKYIKKEQPKFQLQFEMDIKEVIKVKAGRQNFERYVSINGTHYFLAKANTKTAKKLIKKTAKNAIKEAKKRESSETDAVPQGFYTPNVPIQNENIANIPTPSSGKNELVEKFSPEVLEPENQPVEKKKAQNNVEAQFCEHCGEKNLSQAEFCSSCGMKLHQ